MNARSFSTGYFALRVEFLGAPRVLDILFDAAPPEPVNNYAGYFDLLRVEFNGVDLTPALSKDDLAVIAEDVQAELEFEARRRTGDFA